MESVEEGNFRKASYSSSNGGGCVEVASAPGKVYVRDTTNREAGALSVPPEAWTEFLKTIK